MNIPRLKRVAFWATLSLLVLQAFVWMHRSGTLQVDGLGPFVWLFSLDLHGSELPTPWPQVNHALWGFLLPWAGVMLLATMAELVWANRPRRGPPGSIPLQPHVLLRAGSRLLLGLTVMLLTLVQTMNWDDSAEAMRGHGFTTGADALLSGVLVVQGIGALLLATGWNIKLGAWICLAATAPSLFVHPFWSLDAGQFEAELLRLLAELGLIAGLMQLAGTPPKPAPKPAAPAAAPKPAAPKPAGAH